jgi:predicted DNA-binding helix-hairpin-helix protein
MSYYSELEEDIIAMRKRTNLDIDELMRMSALQERTKIFEHLRTLIQQKDSSNDIVAAEVLAWAWKELSS